MNGPDYVKLALMPLSQAYGWYALINRTPATLAKPTDLYNLAAQLSAFYGTWALYRVYVEGNKQEKGHISMGFTFVSALWQHRLATLIASGLAVVNYALPLAFIVPMPVRKLARLAGKNVDREKPVPVSIQVWSATFKAYFVSGIAFWSTLMYKVYSEDA